MFPTETKCSPHKLRNHPLYQPRSIAFGSLQAFHHLFCQTFGCAGRREGQAPVGEGNPEGTSSSTIEDLQPAAHHKQHVWHRVQLLSGQLNWIAGKSPLFIQKTWETINDWRIFPCQVSRTRGYQKWYSKDINIRHLLSTWSRTISALTPNTVCCWTRS